MSVPGLAILSCSLLLGLLATGCNLEEGEPSGGETTTATATTADAVGAGEDTEGESSEPDTGRMSEGEYDLFRTYGEEAADEALQWSEEAQACAVIGQSGDLAGYRDCIKEAWEGTESAMVGAWSNAGDLLDDTAKACRRSLRRYRAALDNWYSKNLTAYKKARALDFDAMAAAFERLPAAAKRYVQASTKALARCEPR